MTSGDRATGSDRGPDAERHLLAAMKQSHDQGGSHLDMILALYRRRRAEAKDPVLAFGLVEATLAADGFTRERALRALAAAAERLQ